MFHRFLLVAATAATMSFTPALAETVTAPTEPPAAPKVPSKPRTVAEAKAEMPALRDLLESQLTDYPGTRFRNVTAGLTEMNEFAICGEVNPKNAMGGYAGWRPFWASTANKTFYHSILAKCWIVTPTPGDFTADISSRP